MITAYITTVVTFNVDSSPGVNDRDGCSPLEAALIWLYNFEGCNDAAICLINHGCGGDKQKAQLLYGACLWDRLDIVKELIELHNLNPSRKWLVLYCEGCVDLCLNPWC